MPHSPIPAIPNGNGPGRGNRPARSGGGRGGRRWKWKASVKC